MKKGLGRIPGGTLKRPISRTRGDFFKNRLKLYKKLFKPEISLAIQIRSEKIGFADFCSSNGSPSLLRRPVPAAILDKQSGTRHIALREAQSQAQIKGR